MAKRHEVIWSTQAELDLQEILLFWIRKTLSKTFSIKLNQEILLATKLLQNYPFAGKLINKNDFRRILVRYYLIIYRIENMQVRILRIWNGKRKEIEL
jgi:plasmid stabilization system protein ParE